MVESWEVMPKMTSELESVTADSVFYFVMNKKFYLNHTGGGGVFKKKRLSISHELWKFFGHKLLESKV